MTDKTPDTEIEEELIVVETPPEDEKIAEAAETDDDEDDGEDDRLAVSEDDSDDDISNSNRKRRHKRREVQRRAKEAAERQIDMLRRQNVELMQRMAAIEGHTSQNVVQTLEQKLQQVRHEIAQAEHVIAKATEAGNGDDVVAAMRLRDQAMAQAQQIEQVRQQAARPVVPKVDPQVVNYAKEWMQANPWYDPAGRDRDSAVTKAIDTELARDGFNPSSREYWEELTARVADAFGEDGSTAKTSEGRPRRKAPPTGATREHAPQSTKREIYVTPERKAAMIDAGIWDDPARRNQMLKAYQAYDKNGSAS
tara:strand:- start:3291 stop:4217 length:927 start_codon:yes stop_codon:yes gene_type:complete